MTNKKSAHRSKNTFELMRDDDFYVDTSSVIFQVENTLFKVSRYPFINGSKAFSEKFNLPKDPADPQGSSDSSPVVLSDVTAVDFKAFLQVIHPLGSPLTQSTPALDSFGVQEWASILRLSTQWSFNDISAKAVERLSLLLNEPDNAETGILLGREFKMMEWLLLSYTIFILRERTITDEEVERIGWKTAIKILRVREQYPHANPPAYCSSLDCKRVDALPRVEVVCPSCSQPQTRGSPVGLGRDLELQKIICQIALEEEALQDWTP